GVPETGLRPVEPDPGLFAARQMSARRTRKQRKFPEEIAPFVEESDVAFGALDEMEPKFCFGPCGRRIAVKPCSDRGANCKKGFGILHMERSFPSQTLVE